MVLDIMSFTMAVRVLDDKRLTLADFIRLDDMRLTLVDVTKAELLVDMILTLADVRTLQHQCFMKFGNEFTFVITCLNSEDATKPAFTHLRDPTDRQVYHSNSADRHV
jgi:hypothetical protein